MSEIIKIILIFPLFLIFIFAPLSVFNKSNKEINLSYLNYNLIINCNILLILSFFPIPIKDYQIILITLYFLIFLYSFIFSKINFKGNYDLKENNNKEYSLGYSYFDECFGINLDFERKFYSDNDLKPQDILTLMFSFKNVGSYKSTNLAVSETDKQDIEWGNFGVNNELFN